MCIIIAKKKNNRLPSEDELKQSFLYNQDGAGFMYTDNGKVIIDKGYMNYKSFIKHFNKLCKKYDNFKNKSLVIHCRIGTGGTNTEKNTHPYPIIKDYNILHKRYFTCSLGMAHNGIINDYKPTDKSDTNDTQKFIYDYLSELKNNYKNFYKSEEQLKALEIITNSKLAFLDDKDNIYLTNNFINDNNLYFSNTSYKSYNTYKYYNNYDYGDWWDDYNNTFSYKETKKEDKHLQAENNKMDPDNIDFVPAGYWLDIGSDTIEVINSYKYFINFDTLELYEMDGNEYKKISDDFVIYDYNFEEVDYIGGVE